MTRLLLLYGLLCSCSMLVNCNSDAGPGIWKVLYIQRCDEDLQLLDIEIDQHKINRSHDAWTGHFVLERDLTYGYGIRIELYKLVDGGYKLQHVMSDNEFINFVRNHFEDTSKSILEYAGIDPPDFPVEAGVYDVKDFIFDYGELPNDGIYGEYYGKIFILKGMDNIFCIEGYADFNEVD